MLGFAYIFLGLVAFLLSVNMLVRLSDRKKVQFNFNLTLLAALSVAISYMLYTQASITLIRGLVSINPFSLFFMLLFTLGMLFVNVLAFNYSNDYPSFAVLSDFSLTGMYLVAFSNSIITIFIGLELASIPSVFIILLSKKSLEAATKFFIMASLGVAIFSFGMALFYGGANGLSMKAHQQNSLLAFASMLFIVSLGFDSSIFPFNVLIPDVYEGSPAYITSMLGGINKKMGFAALVQILILAFVAYRSAFAVLAILSVLTMFYGNIVAMMQRDLKRLLAYSSISQAGYILIGIATDAPSGIAAGLFQIFAHMFLFIGVLSILAWLEAKNRKNIDSLVGLNGENRFAAFALSLFLFSLAGVPLTTGFMGKFLIFLSAINANLAWLAILGVINSIASVYYYSRLVIAAYTRREGARKVALDRSVMMVVAACLAVTIIFGIFPGPVIKMVSNASAYLFAAHP